MQGDMYKTWFHRGLDGYVTDEMKRKLCLRYSDLKTEQETGVKLQPNFVSAAVAAVQPAAAAAAAAVPQPAAAVAPRVDKYYGVGAMYRNAP